MSEPYVYGRVEDILLTIFLLSIPVAAVISVLYGFIGLYLMERKSKKDKRKWELRRGAAEYDRLRNQEWKDLGWKGE